MPLDFTKLNDPAWREKMRLEREAEEAKVEALERKLRDALEICLPAIETLSETERSLVRNCRTRLNMYLLPSDKQQKWLLDIAARLQPQPGAQA
jgi:hypothetical protein